MKSVLISIRPEWVEKICHEIEKDKNGKPIYEKRIEVRKSAPKEVPFKAYIYCSYGDMKTNYYLKGRGKVIGEFVCDKVFLLHPYSYDGGNADLGHRKFIQTFEGASKVIEILSSTCLSQNEMFDYIGGGNYGYGWHISKLKIYDKPKELREFYTIPERGSDCCCSCVCNETPLDEMPCRTCTRERNYLYRPPQSWQYVEEI